MQACMDGYEVVSPYEGGINTGNITDINTRLLQDTDILVTCTGNANVCDAAILSSLKKALWFATLATLTTKSIPPTCAKNWRWEMVHQVHMIYRRKLATI